ncbi:PQQ-binding-like beta-propeller repeat protein [Thermogutta sp.]|uniref:outer membrane protein assembly factor BamB family protein n=1 Tax=Thermogutta sp. TaxID=1962930 RepID=UPI0032201AEC
MKRPATLGAAIETRHRSTAQPRDCVALIAILVVTTSWIWASSGCRKAVITPEAKPWPAIATDPLETDPELEQWPMFRGPLAQGIGVKAHPPIQFSPQQNLKWKVAVPGQGNSSPVVWGDYVLLTSAVGDGREPIGMLLAFRRSDGQLLWRREVGRLHGKTHPKNGYASPSVATDGERIVAFFGSAGLICCDFQGQLLWQKPLGLQEHTYGVAASPIILGDTVIQLCDREEYSFLIAVDKRTGEEVWRTPRDSTGCWTTPVPVRLAKNLSYLVINGGEVGSVGRLSIYDSQTGRTLWSYDGLETLVTPVALFRNQTLFSLSGRNGPILAFHLEGKERAVQARLLWRLPRGGPYIPSGIVYRNRLYVLSDLKWLTCYNPGSGEVIWRAPLEGTFTASLVAADGRLYAVNERGVVFVVAAGDEFRLLSRNEIGGRCLATPALVDRDFILRTDEALYCFNEPAPSRDIDQGNSQPTARGSESGKERKNSLTTSGNALHDSAAESASAKTPVDIVSGTDWPVFRGTPTATGLSLGRFDRPPEQAWVFTAENDSFTATPVVAENTVFLGGNEGNFYAVDLQTGRKRWAWKAPAGILAPAGYSNGNVYVGDINGGFHCLRAQTGEPVWQIEVEGEIDGGPGFATLPSGKQVVVFGSQDTFLYCVDAQTGKFVWKAGGHDQIRCTPPIVEGRTFIAGCDGKLHVVEIHHGQEIAAVDLEGPTGCTPAVVGSLAYVGTENGVFFGIDWMQAKVVWRYDNENDGRAFRASAAVNERYVVVGSRDKAVHCFDRISGQHLWRFPTRRFVDASPVIVRATRNGDPDDDLVLAPSLDGRIYAIRVKDGESLWSLTVGGSISASPVVVQKALLVATEDGDLVCYRSVPDP